MTVLHMNQSDLKPGQFLLMIGSYDAAGDSFTIELLDAITHPTNATQAQLPAILVPFLTGECGSPDEFENSDWIIEHAGFKG